MVIEENSIIQGDCLQVLKELEDNSVDSIITDPPYELGFMGKSWDNTGIANNKEMWKECLRVLKPGAYLLSFGGTRTYHRMASAIEDAGFEVRDMIEWVYGCLSEDTEILTPYGWERYHIYKHLNSQSPIMIYDIENNIYKWEKPKRWSEYTLDKDTCYRIKSDTTDQLVSRNHRCIVEREGKLIFVKAEELSEMEYMPTLSNNFLGLEKGQSKVLFKKMQRILQGIRMEEMGKDRSIESKEQNKTLWRKESSMERRSNLFQNSWELFGSQICPMSKRIYSYGKEGWLCNGTPINNGKTSWKNITKSGSCASQRPQSCKQSDRELNSIQEQCRTQEARGYGITRAKVTKQEYSGIIFCPTVSTGCFIARRKGKIFITGNSGFPKSLNIGKAVDKLQGNEREVLGKGLHSNIHSFADETKYSGTDFKPDITKGTSDWEGWGTALKPAHEPICMARKPLAEKTVAENCLKWGTGGINIDESRVDYQSEADKASATPQGKCTSNTSAGSAPDVDMSEVDYNGERYWYKNEYKWLVDKWLNDEDYVWSELKENLETYDWCKVPEIDNGDRVLFDSGEGVCIRLYESKRKEFVRPEQLGRFPANLIWSHHPDCKRIGFKEVSCNSHYPEMNVTGYGKNYGGKTEYIAEGERPKSEQVESWECVDGCPSKEFEKAGISKSSDNKWEGENNANIYGKYQKGVRQSTFSDSGTPARFFKQCEFTEEDFEYSPFFYFAKASRSERNRGLDEKYILKEDISEEVKQQIYKHLNTSNTDDIL